MKKIVVIVLGVYLIGLVYLWILEGPIDQVEKLSKQSSADLEQLVQTKYFRLIRLNLHGECPLKVQNRICKSKSCVVCRCDEKDIPHFWKTTNKVKKAIKNGSIDLWGKDRIQQNQWVWHVEDQENDQGEYFDLQANIESFTNYDGSSIWSLIYEENCFNVKSRYESLCHEEKVLYKIISGLHTSISTHLSRFYKHQEIASEWADLKTASNNFTFNSSEYQRRVLDFPERVNNLLFLYRIIGQSIKEISPYLLNNFTIQSDEIADDLRSTQLLSQILIKLNAYDVTNKEKDTLKFFNPSNPKVKDYQLYVHNISRILNCVDCEKCKLFGKMQLYGIGTALKILLGYKSPYKRNEIVALLNLFNKLSMSVDTFYQHKKGVILEHLVKSRDEFWIFFWLGGSGLALVYIVWQIDLKKKVKNKFVNVFPGKKMKGL